jgi:hypothetical protein
MKMKTTEELKIVPFGMYVRVLDRAEKAEAERDAMRDQLDQKVEDAARAMWESEPIIYSWGPHERHHVNWEDAIKRNLAGVEIFRAFARAALAPSPAGPDGRNLAVLYCMERAEADVKLLREALEGMIAVAEGRFDGNPHADIDALAKARAALWT